MAVGADRFSYELVPRWGQALSRYEQANVTGVATDSADRVYAFCRVPEQPNVVVFDQQGRFLKSWGADFLGYPHGISIGPDDRVYLADLSRHVVRVCTTDGEVLRTLGTPDRAGAIAAPFVFPTGAAAAPSGVIYVSDGYGNARVHKFDADGTLLLSWGSAGRGPGEFHIPHSVCVDRHERVYVADRENNRVQVFDQDGHFLAEWTDLTRPTDLSVDSSDLVHVLEIGGRVSVFTSRGELVARWDASSPSIAHGISIDSHGVVYICEVGSPNRLHKFARR